MISNIDLLKTDISDQAIELACEASKEYLHQNIDFRYDVWKTMDLYYRTGMVMMPLSNASKMLIDRMHKKSYSNNTTNIDKL